MVDFTIKKRGIGKMGVTESKKRVIWLLWTAIVPFGIWYSYINYPPSIPVRISEIFPYIVLTCIVAAMPVVINRTTLFFIQWVALAVFLQYGLFVEIILTQLAAIIVMLRIKVSKEQLYRFPLNSLMFFIISYFSGLIYFSLGGELKIDPTQEPYFIWLVFIYAISYYTINQILIIFIQYVLFKRKYSIFQKDFIWESITFIVTLPLGLVLYVLYLQLGMLAVLFVGIPFASLSIILKLYYTADQINGYLKKASDIGHQLAERLKVEEVIDLFMQRIGELFRVDYTLVLEVNENKQLQLLKYLEKGQNSWIDFPLLEKGEGITGYVWATKKAILFTSKKEWMKMGRYNLPEQAQTILAVPLIRNNEVVGVILLGSETKNAYEQSQLMIADILCSHFAVAIENAKHYEREKKRSEHCALTKLYNYRYFDELMQNEFIKLKHSERQSISLIILDIDHFKSINDTYGHQGGNEVLCEIASRLSNVVDNDGTVARYGGEEFVVLLPNIFRSDALQIAEEIRQAIADKPFVIHNYLKADREELMVTITASFGVATAPDDADEPLALIRHADRALYVGAKQTGRNRVAGYVK